MTNFCDTIISLFGIRKRERTPSEQKLDELKSQLEANAVLTITRQCCDIVKYMFDKEVLLVEKDDINPMLKSLGISSHPLLPWTYIKIDGVYLHKTALPKPAYYISNNSEGGEMIFNSIRLTFMK